MNLWLQMDYQMMTLPDWSSFFIIFRKNTKYVTFYVDFFFLMICLGVLVFLQYKNLTI